MRFKSPKIIVLISFLIGFLVFSCKNESKIETLSEVAYTNTANKTNGKPVSEAFKDYWYNSTAEVTSYALEQARYGEMRGGNAVLIFVTEPFEASKQVKADKHKKDNIPVLKLNQTKSFLTGIYPYSIMSSTFYPVADNSHALKITNSVQEWCGQVYAQLNNKKSFEVSSFSYFESEGDQKIALEKNILENELWSKIRINPTELPVGDILVIPAIEYIRLSHKKLKAYKAVTTLSKENDTSIYTLNYPELDRTLSITFTTKFPHTIENWTESYKSGFGKSAKILTTKATKIKRLQTAYWYQNSNKYSSLRDTLGL